MRVTAHLALASLLAACTAAEPPSDAGDLVVTGSEGGVYLVDPEDGERVTLQEEGKGGAPVQPTASPDGEVVVWTAIEENGSVVRIHQEGATREVGVPTLPFYYAFDAGTATLAALGNEPDGEGVALMLVDLLENASRIVDVASPYYLDWHPEQSRLGVHVGFQELAVLEEGERRPLPVETGDFQAPAWTEDGRLVAVRRSEGAPVSRGVQVGSEELVLVDPSDGSLDEVANVNGPVAFDVAEEQLAFVEGGVGALEVVGLNGENRSEVTSETVVAFEWSPDGELLLFLVIEEDAGLVPHVWDGDETGAYPAFEPTAVFVGQYLPFWTQYTRSITMWAPDGNAFAYAAAGDDPTVWVQPLEEERHDVGGGVMVTWSP